MLGGATLSQAQTLSFWVNKTGDPSTLTPSVISVSPSSTISLSVYAKTTGMTNLFGLDTLVGYDTTTTTGASATPGGSQLTFGSLTWAGPFASATTPDVLVQQGGGFSASGSRPYGTLASATKSTGDWGSFAAGVKAFDIVINVGALAIGETRTITIYSGLNGTLPADNWSSSAIDTNFQFAGANNYTVTLQAVPEPATLVVLGLGLVGIARRKRTAA